MDRFKRSSYTKKIPVIYCGKGGFLVASSTYLSFTSNNSNGSKAINRWAWRSLGRITSKAIMRISQVDPAKKALLFQFENQDALMAATQDFSKRIAQAKMPHKHNTVTGDHFSDELSDLSTNNTVSSTGTSQDVTGGSWELPQNRDEFEALVNRLLEARTSSVQEKGVLELVNLNSSTTNQTETTDASLESRLSQMERELEALRREVGKAPNNKGKLPPSFSDKVRRSDNEEEDRVGLIVQINSAKWSPTEEDEWHAPFGETAFTLLYLCSVNSFAFWYGALLYCLQLSTICLTLLDIIEDVPGNRLGLPPMVSLTVSCAQAVALVIALAYQSDLIEAAIKLQNGFYPEVLEIHPEATYDTWLLSCLAQLLAGLLQLALSFVLTMQAETVVDTMLNLTALLFMAEIDDIGFYIAKMGFVKTSLQEQLDLVVDFKVPKRERSNTLRRILYLMTLIGLFTGYGILKDRQLNGSYLQNYLYVQFGDAYNPKIPYYSGIMTSGNVRTTGYREYRDVGTGNILLSYCSIEKAWTFSETDDACDNFFAKSSETSSYDVTSTPYWEWQVRDSHSRLQPFVSFNLVGRDCDPTSCQGTCASDGLCQCPHDRFGLDCEFPSTEVCNGMTIDDRFGPFPTTEDDQVGTSFELLKNSITGKYVSVYSMPVYYSNKAYPANVVFFAGRRWIITSERDLFNLAEAELKSPSTHYFPQRTVATLENEFHGYHQASYTPLFISEAVDYETPYFLPTPSGLHWWSVKSMNESARNYAPDVLVDAVFACGSVECLGEPREFCGAGRCNNETGLCECQFGYSGGRCQYQSPCYEEKRTQYQCNSGNGFCDESTGVCRCDFPYHGKICDHQYKCYEEGGRCKYGGLCDMITGECYCPDPSTRGVACEETTDCSVVGCENGGYCGQLSRKCICRPPFHGNRCDLVDTSQDALFCSMDDDCVNGSCNTDTGICTCENPSSFGTLCQHEFNCSKSAAVGYLVPCLNDGVCNEQSGLCECPEPYSGPDCSQVPACTNDDDCVGTGETVNSCDLETGRCKCWRGVAAGKLCENSIYCSSDDDCHNGGVCLERSCECPRPYTGIYCESWLEDEKYTGLLSDFHDFMEEMVQCCGFDDPQNCTDPACQPNDDVYFF